MWHICERVATALLRLNDEICSFERETGREYTLILIPRSLDEEIHISQSGKPLQGMSPEEILATAINRRK